MAKFDARDALLATHLQRNLDRSAIGLWVGTLDDACTDRFLEYVSAFHAMRPQISTPTFSEAIRRDEVLGQFFPKISNESMKKWLARSNPDGEESQG